LFTCSDRFFLEVGIFASHIIWRWRNRDLLRAAKTSRRTVDELLEEREQQKSTATTSETSTGVKKDLESHGNGEAPVPVPREITEPKVIE
jgi:hypothetical protein